MTKRDRLASDIREGVGDADRDNKEFGRDRARELVLEMIEHTRSLEEEIRLTRRRLEIVLDEIIED